MKTLILAVLLLYSNEIFACESSGAYRKCEKSCNAKKSIADFFDCAQECKDTYCIDDIEEDSLSVERDIDETKWKKSSFGG